MQHFYRIKVKFRNGHLYSRCSSCSVCIRHTMLYQRWIIMVEYWSRRRATIFQRWSNVDASTLKIVRHFKIESTLKYGRYLNIDGGWNMVVSLMFSRLWNNEWVLFISISTFYLLNNHNTYAAKSKTSFTMNGCNHTWMRTLSLVEKFWTRSL